MTVVNVTPPVVSPGQSVGAFRIIRRLGAGGMGVVYEAHNQALDRREALKFLARDDADMERRFLREARIAAGLSHPGIVPVYHFGVHGMQCYLSMALVSGDDAGTLLERSQAMSDETVLRWIADVGRALDYAHGRGVVHRDVKPANILVTSDGDALLTDFGISRSITSATLTETGALIGTLAYMAPEQVSGDKVGPAADQYALACTAFHLLARRPPFQGDAAAVLGQHLTKPPPELQQFRPGLRNAGSVLARSLGKDPADRYASCTEMAEELLRAVDADTAARIDTLVDDGLPTAYDEAVVLAPLASGDPFGGLGPRPVEIVSGSDLPEREPIPSVVWWASGLGFLLVLVLLIVI